MGKVKARELKDVHVDYVSFVTEGANGETFTIFKRAKTAEEVARDQDTDATPEGDVKTGEEEQMTPEEKAALEKAAAAVETLAKANAEQVERIEAAVKAVESSQTAMTEVVARLDAVEKAAKTPETTPAPAVEPTANDLTDMIAKMSESLGDMQEQVAKLAGQKREPAGTSTEDTQSEETTKGIFAGVFRK